MDTIARLKESLISRIKDSNDIDFLMALQQSFESANPALYALTPEQEKAIEAGRKQIKSGDLSSHAHVMTQARQWLNKK
jgi:hypothetical protein